MNAKELVSQMTLEEKASLLSGLDFWHIKSIERLGLPKIMMTDGPHGLRKQRESTDNSHLLGSHPATCFPTAAATACSFDRELLEEIGYAMGEECLQEGVSIILGPGVNIKRSPLCGRNFEYFSEDPLLAGEMGAALINGVQKTGAGVSLKHYAVNNQEYRRMTINAVVDDRALREIYLKAFEIPVKKAKPWTLMCSYNRINGAYSSDNKWLLTDVLRENWGFNGLVMTDWGAMNDRVQSVTAGLDLEMPASGGLNDEKVIAAIKNGILSERDVDKLAERITDLILKSVNSLKENFKYDAEKHNAIARKAAAQSCVLLKNDDNILPLKKGAKVAVIGGFAKTPRYQGAGSSLINPLKLENAYDELAKTGFELTYAEGYNDITEAVNIAKNADVALVFAGLPDEIESEGFDRSNMEMPKNHVTLIESVAQANPNTAVILQLGAPVVTGWAKCVKGLVVSYLGGQAGGGGITDVLTGLVNPSGKLAETWSLKLEDNPSYHNFPGGKKTVEYRESIFVGYRYYETANINTAWQFGYGLSYTTFEYSGISVNNRTVTFTLKNTGNVDGAEVAQIYVGLPNSKIVRAKKTLAAFEKVFLKAGESKTIKIDLHDDAFRYYNTAAQDWRIEEGDYAVYAGSSSADIKLTANIHIKGDGDEKLIEAKKNGFYGHLKGNDFPKDDFFAVYGRAIPNPERGADEPYTVSDTLEDIKHTPIGAKVYAMTDDRTSQMYKDVPPDLKLLLKKSIEESPLRSLPMTFEGKLPPNFADLLVGALNGNPSPEIERLLGL